ncbi:MAG: acetate--CoA ligase family protein [Desulfobacter sp.]|nr:MAG: acetate--CoA ligase family protein [Desulfobacter sp.]
MSQERNRPDGVFKRLFYPQSIAVIGASNNELKPGGRVFKNILEGGYGGQLWPVNPKSSRIMGLSAFPDIDSLPEAPDLALVAIPAPAVPGAVNHLALKGNRAAIILTAGFGETGEAGKKMEDQILHTAEAHGMAVVGPNCSGFLTPAYSGKFAGIIPPLQPGCVDVVSGSGATVDYLMEQAGARGIRFSHVVNLGNSIQLGVEDMLGLLDGNHGPRSAKIILLYLEAVGKPGKLLAHARSLIRKGCTLIGIKSGASGAGARAAASHTGAMATADHTVQALLDKAGIIRVKSKAELIETTCALMAMSGLPQGNRACIVTDAGGPGVMLADALEREGISLPRLSGNTLDALGQVLPPQAALENPIDCLPSRTGGQLQAVFEVLGKKEAGHLDMIFFISGNSGLSDNGEIYDAVAAAQKSCPIPILPVLSSITTCEDLLKEWARQGRVYFLDEVAAGAAAGRLVHRPRPDWGRAELPDYDREALENLLSDQTGALSSTAAKAVLHAAGFTLPRQQVASGPGQLEAACRAIGFPLAMKVEGLLHKTDLGGVRVNITTMDQALGAWHELMVLPGARGVMVQEMVRGLEVIIGAVRDGEFGSLIMFGLGGIHAEVLKDVRFSLSTPEFPLSPGEAEKMIRGIRSYPILEGVRGQAGVCPETLADCLVRTARLVTDFPGIRELDLNPVKGEGAALYAVDARILMD